MYRGQPKEERKIDTLVTSAHRSCDSYIEISHVVLIWCGIDSLHWK